MFFVQRFVLKCFELLLLVSLIVQFGILKHGSISPVTFQAFAQPHRGVLFLFQPNANTEDGGFLQAQVDGLHSAANLVGTFVPHTAKICNPDDRNDCLEATTNYIVEKNITHLFLTQFFVSLFFYCNYRQL